MKKLLLLFIIFSFLFQGLNSIAQTDQNLKEKTKLKTKSNKLKAKYKLKTKSKN